MFGLFCHLNMARTTTAPLSPRSEKRAYVTSTEEESAVDDRLDISYRILIVRTLYFTINKVIIKNSHHLKIFVANCTRQHNRIHWSFEPDRRSEEKQTISSQSSFQAIRS